MRVVLRLDDSKKPATLPCNIAPQPDFLKRGL
jgi:hypothetical protein